MATDEKPGPSFKPADIEIVQDDSNDAMLSEGMENQEATISEAEPATEQMRDCCGIRRRSEMILRRTGLCPCVVQECLGNQTSCRLCARRKLARYNQLEDEFYREEFGDDIEENCEEFLVVKFHLSSPEVRENCPLLVTKTMTAINAVQAICIHLSVPDYKIFSLYEFWAEFEAERLVDDHELILPLRHNHVKSKQRLLFFHHKDLDKYDYLRNKDMYFIHPDSARTDNLKKKINEDPSLIQIRDPFFCKPHNPLSYIPIESQPSSPKTSPTMEHQKKEKETISVESEISTIRFSKSLDTTVDDPSTLDIEAPLLSPSESFSEPVPSTSSTEPPTLPDLPVDPPVIPAALPYISTEGEPDLVDVSENWMINPIYCSTVFVKQGDYDMTVPEIKKLPSQKEKCRWSKKYLLLRDRNLFLVDDHSNMLKCYYMRDYQFQEMLNKPNKSKKERNMLTLIGSMREFEVYSGTKGRRYHNAPYGGCIYLRKIEKSLKKPLKMMFCPKPKQEPKMDGEAPDLISKGRNLWVTAMRVAKHGAQLKDSYLQYRGWTKDFQPKKVNEEPEPFGKTQMTPDSPTSSIAQRSVREISSRDTEDPRVPMDFTDGTGRIVHDQAEIDEIRRETRKSLPAERFDRYETFPKEALEHGSHLTQRYYHGDLSRIDAERLLLGTNETGAWLLRNSNIRTNCLTLSYLYKRRVHHRYITAATYRDDVGNKPIYVATLDHQVAFYDVHSLIEFYRLNIASGMLCTLSRSIKRESQPDSTPPRNIVNQGPLKSSPIDLTSGLQKDEHNESLQSVDSSKSRSLKDFLSKSIQKSKQALRTKKLPLQASTSKEDPSAVPLKQEEGPLESPSSSSQAASTSGISSQTSPESPPQEQTTSKSSDA